MNSKTITRITITGATATLCLGLGTPAVAHDDAAARGTATAAHDFTAPTLAQQRAWFDQFITARIQRLDALVAGVAADPKLTDAQTAGFATKVAEIRQRLVDLKAAVDAAATTGQLRTALMASLPEFAWPVAPHHVRPEHRQVENRTPRRGDPEAVTPTASTVSTRTRSFLLTRDTTTERAGDDHSADWQESGDEGRSGDGTDFGDHHDGDHHDGDRSR